MTQDSICCGATINYQDFCSECGEHTGAIQFEDADGNEVMQYVNADGFLKDQPKCRCGHTKDTHQQVFHADSQFPVEECRTYKCFCACWEPIAKTDGCCDECFSPSQDVNYGYGLVAVPDGCKDEECECHEYEPNFKGFVSTVSAKEIATVGLVVLMFVIAVFV